MLVPDSPRLSFFYSFFIFLRALATLAARERPPGGRRTVASRIGDVPIGRRTEAGWGLLLMEEHRSCAGGAIREVRLLGPRCWRRGWLRRHSGQQSGDSLGLRWPDVVRDEQAALGGGCGSARNEAFAGRAVAQHSCSACGP